MFDDPAGIVLLAPLALGGLLSAVAFGLVELPFLVLELFHSFFRGSREKLEVKGRKSENENVKIDT